MAKIVSYTEGVKCDICESDDITVTFSKDGDEVLVVCLDCITKVQKKMHRLKSFAIQD